MPQDNGELPPIFHRALPKGLSFLTSPCRIPDPLPSHSPTDSAEGHTNPPFSPSPSLEISCNFSWIQCYSVSLLCTVLQCNFPPKSLWQHPLSRTEARLACPSQHPVGPGTQQVLVECLAVARTHPAGLYLVPPLPLTQSSGPILLPSLGDTSVWRSSVTHRLCARPHVLKSAPADSSSLNGANLSPITSISRCSLMDKSGHGTRSWCGRRLSAWLEASSGFLPQHPGATGESAGRGLGLGFGFTERGGVFLSEQLVASAPLPRIQLSPSG